LPPDTELARPVTAASGRRIGAEAVRDLAVRVHRLRLADDLIAGGDLVVPAFRELRSTLTVYREASYTSATGRALLGQIGECTARRKFGSANIGARPTMRRWVLR
jgi:hypothetical protein